LDRDGYVVLHDVFTRSEMDEIANSIEAHHRRTVEWVRQNGQAAGISAQSEITFTCHLAEQDPKLRAFCLRPEFVAISTELLGPDVDLYWNQSVFKEPEGNRIFPWHQDDGYAEVDPSPYLTLWLALNDATPENGCISVLPGRYKDGLLPHRESPHGWVCHEADDPDQGVMVPVPAGSIAAFWSLTPHKSGSNRSLGVRKAYVIQFTKAGTRLVKTGEALEDKLPVARRGRAVLS
jgi:ectoine hydroxylase-related dioxygenase (phytanoyl-CoA dioxygenase family)